MNRATSQLSLLDTSHSGSGSPALMRIAHDVDYENAYQIVDEVKKRLSLGAKEIIMDTAEVNMIDSSGLKALLQSKHLCDEAKVSFQLQSVTCSVSRIIRMSGFAPTFGLAPLEIEGGSRPDVKSLDLDAPDWKVSERQSLSDARVISVLRRVVQDAALEIGAESDELCDIQIAVGEAITNAFRHGSPVKGTSRIKLRCMTRGRVLVVEVEDEGAPFDPDAVCKPDPCVLRDHGMGIYLMRQAMDIVQFTSNGKGNCVRMVKWLRGK